MAKLMRRLRKDERGMSLVLVGLSFMAFLSATTLAIDIGMLMTARAQTQNAADAGAHAGAVALAFNDFNNRSSSGPAVQAALNAATSEANNVMHDAVSITPGDVTFPNDANGQPNWVRVEVFRSASRSNAVGTLMASFFGVNTADITATATAEAALANAVTCVKPFALPDRWTERQTPGWDQNDTFSAFPANPSVVPDIFKTASTAGYTGYTVMDKGMQLTITPEVGTVIKGNMFWNLNLPGGGGFFSDITGCDPSTMRYGDPLAVDASATPSDVTAGVSSLISQDPGAYWDSANGRVVSSQFPSPRVMIVPTYDPYYFDQGKKVGDFTQLRVSNFVGLFLESEGGGSVTVRIVPVGGLIAGSSTPPAGAFPRAVRLVE
jgi:Flp pilus assembly protein TadG